jgi:hypothetical protein
MRRRPFPSRLTIPRPAINAKCVKAIGPPGALLFFTEEGQVAGRPDLDARQKPFPAASPLLQFASWLDDWPAAG